MKKVTVKVLLFAKAKELCGKREGSITVNSIIGYNDLLEQIVKEFSLQVVKNNIILAINEEYPPPDKTLTLEAEDIIAVIPPLSGG